MFEMNWPKKLLQFRKKYWYQQVEHMQVPNGTGPGVRRSKRPLSACYTSRKSFIESSHKSINGRVWYKGHGLVKSLIGGGLPLYLVRLQNTIKHSWERNFLWFDKIPYRPLNFFNDDFKHSLTYPWSVSLFESHVPLRYAASRPCNHSKNRIISINEYIRMYIFCILLPCFFTLNSIIFSQWISCPLRGC